MAHVEVISEVELDSPTLVEGLPGAGLVGKIAADHLVESFGMEEYGRVRCEGLPEAAVYRADDSRLRPPVRLYADAERGLLVLQSDVPVSPKSAREFSTCITGWLVEQDATPIYLSGLPEEKSGVPKLFGVSTGDGTAILEEAGIGAPPEPGLVSGPTGALLYQAGLQDLDSVGLVVQTDPQFPDPEAARVVLTDGIEPITGVSVDTDELVEQAEEIRKAREKLARRMQEADEESSQAQPLRMFQ